MAHQVTTVPVAGGSVGTMSGGSTTIISSSFNGRQNGEHMSRAVTTYNRYQTSRALFGVAGIATTVGIAPAFVAHKALSTRIAGRTLARGQSVTRVRIKSNAAGQPTKGRVKAIGTRGVSGTEARMRAVNGMQREVRGRGYVISHNRSYRKVGFTKMSPAQRSAAARKGAAKRRRVKGKFA